MNMENALAAKLPEMDVPAKACTTLKRLPASLWAKSRVERSTMNIFTCATMLTMTGSNSSTRSRAK